MLMANVDFLNPLSEQLSFNLSRPLAGGGGGGSDHFEED